MGPLWIPGVFVILIILGLVFDLTRKGKERHADMSQKLGEGGLERLRESNYVTDIIEVQGKIGWRSILHDRGQINLGIVTDDYDRLNATNYQSAQFAFGVWPELNDPDRDRRYNFILAKVRTTRLDRTMQPYAVIKMTFA